MNRSTESQQLSERQKKRILEIEMIKLEAQKQFEKKQKLNLQKLINTPIFIWILSTVIVGLITFTYKNISQNNEQRAKMQNLFLNCQKKIIIDLILLMQPY